MEALNVIVLIAFILLCVLIITCLVAWIIYEIQDAKGLKSQLKLERERNAEFCEMLKEHIKTPKKSNETKKAE